MIKRPRRKLTLTTESLRVLNPARLGLARGGTVLVNPDDPISAPPTDRDTGGPKRTTDYTCTCIG
jgi:hypothetical protein